MKTVIYGLSKTGTSALFYKLKSSLAPDTICLFEPASRGPIARLRVGLKSALTGQGRRDVLAKVLPFEPKPVRVGDFAAFDKQILIVRDPRDRLISALLYRFYNSDVFRREDALFGFIRLLRRKEAQPNSVPVLAILEYYSSLVAEPFSLALWAERYGRREIQAPLAFPDHRPGLFLFRYEDMIDGRFAGLEGYLGRALRGSAMVAEEVRNVTRTMSYGGWRDWFTREDIDHLGPTLQPYLDRHYPGADWRLNETPQITADHGSRYVERVANEKRAGAGLPAVHAH